MTPTTVIVVDSVSTLIARIRARNTRGVMNAIENGIDFHAVKAQLAHGEWSAQKQKLASEAGYDSVRTAERHMLIVTRLCETFDTNRAGLRAQLTEIEQMLANPKTTNLSAFYALTQSDTPLEVMASSIARLRGGESLTTKDVKTAKRQAAINARLQQIRVPHVVHEIVTKNDVHPAAVDALMNMRPEERQEIAVSGAVFNPVTGKDVPIDEADESTWLLASTFSEKEKRETDSPAAFDATGYPADLLFALTGVLRADERYRILIYKRGSK
jgi:hypothetical protein